MTHFARGFQAVSDLNHEGLGHFHEARYLRDCDWKVVLREQRASFIFLCQIESCFINIQDTFDRVIRIKKKRR